MELWLSFRGGLGCCAAYIVAVLVGVMRACGIGLAWLDMGSIPQYPESKRMKSCRKGYM